jgi:hypothetical protein
MKIVEREKQKRIRMLMELENIRYNRSKEIKEQYAASELRV